MGILFSKAPIAVEPVSEPVATEPVSIETIEETTSVPPTTTEPIVANVTETTVIENVEQEAQKGTTIEVAPVDVNPGADVVKKSKNKKKSKGKH
jgi:hypothetical protein